MLYFYFPDVWLSARKQNTGEVILQMPSSYCEVTNTGKNNLNVPNSKKTNWTVYYSCSAPTYWIDCTNAFIYILGEKTLYHTQDVHSRIK